MTGHTVAALEMTLAILSVCVSMYCLLVPMHCSFNAVCTIQSNLSLRPRFSLVQINTLGGGGGKIVNIFLSISFNICFGCSKDGSFEYPQHMFWLRNKNINF